MSPIPVQSLVLMVVEDSAVQRAFAVELCRTLGASRIIEAHDGTSALALLADPGNHPDAIILDLEMPNMDGVDMAERLHAADLLIPLVIVSQRDVDVIESVRKLLVALGLPVLGAVQKPLRLDALRDALADIMI